MKPTTWLLVGVLSVGGSALAQTQTQPQTPGDPLHTAKEQFRAGKYDEAIKSYRSILQQTPGSAPAHAGLLRTLVENGDTDAALAEADVALSKAPDSAEVHEAVGELDFWLAKFQAAKDQLGVAIDLDGRNARAYFVLGKIAEGHSLHKTARELFTEAYNLDSDDPEIKLYWIHTRPKASDRLAALKTMAAGNVSDPLLKDYLQRRIALETAIDAKGGKVCELASAPKASTTSLELMRERPRDPPEGWAIHVKVNTSSSALLQLDTGASGIILTNGAAQRLGVHKILDNVFGGVGDAGGRKGYLGWIDTLEAGGAEFHNCLVEVAEKNVLGDLDGLIGTDVFEKYLVTLDLTQNKLKLDPLAPIERDPTYDDYDAQVTPEMQAFTPVYRFGHQLLVATSVNDQPPTYFLIDSGAQVNIVSSRAAKSTTHVGRDYETIVRGVSGEVRKVYAAQKVNIHFSRYKQQNDDIIAFDLTDMSRGIGVELGGVLGRPLLRMFAITIDYRDSLVKFDFQPGKFLDKEVNPYRTY